METEIWLYFGILENEYTFTCLGAILALGVFEKSYLCILTFINKVVEWTRATYIHADVLSEVRSNPGLAGSGVFLSWVSECT